MLHPGSVVGYDRWPPARLAIGHPQPSARLQGEISHVSKIWRGHLSHLITRSLDPQILQNSFHTHQISPGHISFHCHFHLEGHQFRWPGYGSLAAREHSNKAAAALSWAYRLRIPGPKFASPCFTMHHSELSKMHGNTMDNKDAGSKVGNGKMCWNLLNFLWNALGLQFHESFLTSAGLALPELGQIFICEIPVSNAQEPAFNFSLPEFLEGKWSRPPTNQHQEPSSNLGSISIMQWL